MRHPQRSVRLTLGAGLVAMLVVPLQAQPLREFVFEKAPFPSCHASTLVELPDGEILAAWFGGTAEGRPDVAIWAARRTASGWSQPIELAREPEVPTWNPVLFYTADGRLWLYYKFGPSPQTWTAARRASADHGRTWSAIEHLPAGLYGPIRSKPLLLPDGTLVSGTSVESYRSWACWIERSADHGRSWQRIGPITVARDVPRRDAAGPAPAEVPGSSEWKRIDGIIQPAVVPLGGNRLRFYARSTASIGRICVADSFDDGRSWTQARPIDLPNPNAAVDAIRLDDGRIVLIYNHSDRARTPLNLAVSRDGERFRSFYTLEDQPGEYSYPALIQARNGDLLITYTWRRQRIAFVRFPLGLVPAE